MKNIKELGWRIPCSLAITATIAFMLMWIAGGAAMYCIDPPAADPVREWKVPLAWATSSGISTFFGILVGSFRSESLATPLIVCLATIGMFVIARCWPPSSRQLQYMEEELWYGIPSLFIGGIIACLITMMTRKTEQAVQADGENAAA